jgi:hypothetical protein
MVEALGSVRGHSVLDEVALVVIVVLARTRVVLVAELGRTGLQPCLGGTARRKPRSLRRSKCTIIPHAGIVRVLRRLIIIGRASSGCVGALSVEIASLWLLPPIHAHRCTLPPLRVLILEVILMVVRVIVVDNP